MHMKKSIFVFIGIILVLSILGEFYKNGFRSKYIAHKDTTPQTPVIETPKSMTWRDSAVKVPDKLAQLKLPVKLDYLWGMVEYDSSNGRNVTEAMPKINGLYTKSAMWFCPKDTCTALRVVIAVKCPHNRNLMNWFTKALHKEVSCLDIVYKTSVPNPSEKLSAESQCNHYIRFFKNYFKIHKCQNEGPEPIEQNGLLISDVWNNSRFFTFAVAQWYDMLSSGDNTRVSFSTVDSKTGKQLELGDIVELGDSTAFGVLLLKHLRNYNKMFASLFHKKLTINDGVSLLRDFDGCALTKDGILIIYYPYKISIGADGHFYAQIPYQEIKNKGIKLKVKL